MLQIPQIDLASPGGAGCSCADSSDSRLLCAQTLRRRASTKVRPLRASKRSSRLKIRCLLRAAARLDGLSHARNRPRRGPAGWAVPHGRRGDGCPSLAPCGTPSAGNGLRIDITWSAGGVKLGQKASHRFRRLRGAVKPGTVNAVGERIRHDNGDADSNRSMDSHRSNACRTSAHLSFGAS